MNKNYIEIKYGDKPIIVATIKSGSVTDYLKLKKEADKNFEVIKNTFLDALKDLDEKIADLEKEVKHLKGED